MIAVMKRVQRYGFHSLFHKLGTDNSMKNHVKEPRSFTLERVIIEYKTHTVYEPAIVNDTNQVELSFSFLSIFKCYDTYEQYNLALSRLAIEALTSSTLRDKIQVRC